MLNQAHSGQKKEKKGTFLLAIAVPAACSTSRLSRQKNENQLKGFL